MKVAYVALAPFISGAERSLQATIRACEGLGVEPYLVTHADSPMLQWAKDHGLEASGHDLGLFDRRSPLASMRRMWRLRRDLLRRRISVIHSNQLWSLPQTMAAIRNLPIRSICHLRDPLGSDSGWWLKRPADVTVCISQHLATSLRQHCPLVARAFRVEVLINPVELPPRPTAGTSCAARLMARTQLSLPSDAFVVGFVGQLSPVKGIETLLEAAARVRRSTPIHLLVAGKVTGPDQDYMNVLRSKAESAGVSSSVNFLGFLDDVSVVYSASNVIAVPSLQEPLGRVPLEAGAHYRPSIVSNVDGLPETVLDGRTGWLVPPAAPQPLAEAIERAMASDLDAMGLAARRFVEEVADPGKYGEQLLRLYTEGFESRE